MNESPSPESAEKPFPTSATMVIGGLLLTILGALIGAIAPRIRARQAKHATRKSKHH